MDLDPLEEQSCTDQDKERQRERLERRVSSDDLRNLLGKDGHHEHRDNDGSHHHADAIRHADGRDDRVDGEDNVHQADLHKHETENRLAR